MPGVRTYRMIVHSLLRDEAFGRAEPPMVNGM
ncbi:MAG: hypothetical protein JWQ95_3390 [Sphaerisporangium sp.]|jgi:hypothetical protein|nr:hypothetical protein [Sphaerisporangium sp.]